MQHPPRNRNEHVMDRNALCSPFFGLMGMEPDYPGLQIDISPRHGEGFPRLMPDRVPVWMMGRSQGGRFSTTRIKFMVADVHLLFA